jgi:hypothetical protein
MSGLEKTAAGLKLIAVAERLREIEADRVAGRIKPIQAGDMRGKVLCEGVMTLALHLGVTLKAVNAIDANGELSIVSQGKNPWDASGVPFSKEFCDVLTAHTKPRCGMPGTVAVMNPENSNWCRINHFDCERMILAVVDSMV